MEKFNFKFAYAIAIVIQFINAIVTPIIMEADFSMMIKKSWYSYAVCASLITNNCHLIFYPVILSKMYGTNGGLLAYSVGFTYLAIATLVNTFMLNVMFDRIGFMGIAWIYAILLVIAFLILIFVYKGSKTNNTMLQKNKFEDNDDANERKSAYEKEFNAQCKDYCNVSESALLKESDTDFEGQSSRPLNSMM